MPKPPAETALKWLNATAPRTITREAALMATTADEQAQMIATAGMIYGTALEINDPGLAAQWARVLKAAAAGACFTSDAFIAGVVYARALAEWERRQAKLGRKFGKRRDRKPRPAGTIRHANATLRDAVLESFSEWRAGMEGAPLSLFFEYIEGEGEGLACDRARIWLAGDLNDPPGVSIRAARAWLKA